MEMFTPVQAACFIPPVDEVKVCPGAGACSSGTPNHTLRIVLGLFLQEQLHWALKFEKV